MPTVLIVDDHAAFRALARRRLAADFDVVGEAHDGRSAIAASERLRPDVVLLDIGLPDIDGFEVARRLSGFTVVLVSSREAADYGERIAQSEAAGFIAKETLSTWTLHELLHAR